MMSRKEAFIAKIERPNGVTQLEGLLRARESVQSSLYAYNPHGSTDYGCLYRTDEILATALNYIVHLEERLSKLEGREVVKGLCNSKCETV